jgi:hypothetical protein
MNAFKVGDKVICINDAYSVRIPQCMFMDFPKKGREYIVRGFCEKGISMHLEEIRNEPVPKRGEIWFYNWRFKKAVVEIEKCEKSIEKVEQLVNI